MTARSRPASIAAMVLLVLVTLADEASFDDPRDSSGSLDIAKVAHTNDDENATYRVEFYDTFDLEDIDGLAWAFDFNGDGEPAEACALMRKIGTTGILRVGFFRDCGPEAWATADATVGDRTIEFSLPLIDLVEGGGLRPDEPYSYNVTARDADGVEDTAPQSELAVHEDVPVPTPRSGSAETELGFPGESAATGAGNAARPAGAEDRLVPGEGEGPAPEAEGIERIRFRFGPIPVCSGASCYALGVLAPVAAFALYRVVSGRIRARRERSPIVAVPQDDRPAPEHEARSHPGHL